MSQACRELIGWISNWRKRLLLRAIFLAAWERRPKCHEIKETVSLERCKCGKSYEQWGRRPAPPCSKSAENQVRKESPGETSTEQGESKGKRAQRESNDGKRKEKERKSKILGKLWKKIKKQADIRHILSDTSHGSRVGLCDGSRQPYQPFSSSDPLVRGQPRPHANGYIWREQWASQMWHCCNKQQCTFTSWPSVHSAEGESPSATGW